MSLHEWFEQIFSAKDLMSWLVTSILILFSTLTIKLILRLITARLRLLTERTASVWDDVGVDLIEGVNGAVVFAWLFFVSTKALSPSAFMQKTIWIIVVVLTIFQIGIWGHHLIRSWRNAVLNKKIEDDPSSSAAIGLLYTTIQVSFIAVIVLIGLSNLGIDIGALLAGLGVGGIAVALAAQNVLGDLLASLSIVLDKPFVVGDFIVAGNEKGTIEHIGIKTTRLRSVSGEELILSNKDLLESRIHNHKRMWRRRAVINFGVVYSTSTEVLQAIPIWVKTFVEQHEKLLFDRCHFVKFGESSLDFELVFFVLDSDYSLYMDFQQRLLIDIFRKLSEENVDFAYPTQSLFVKKLIDKENVT